MENEESRIILPKMIYDRIEEDVVKLHIELGLSIPVKPMDVAKRLGYIVKRISEFNGEKKTLMSLFRNDKDGNRRDGLSYYDPDNGTFVILVNDIDSLYEERDGFTIMHEIGHIRMGHRGDSLLAEKIANYYAAYALVPSPLPNMYKCSGFADIIDVFEVSTDCALICAKRCMNWALYFGTSKPYEKELKTYYKGVLKGEKSL